MKERKIKEKIRNGEKERRRGEGYEEVGEEKIGRGENKRINVKTNRKEREQ